MTLEVVACDIDKQYPAKTYTITVSDGRSISKDLCEEHAGYLEDLLEELDVEEPEAEAEKEPVVPKRGTAKKVVAKKAAPARRRPKITSFEEIEARKQG
jgi:hypothetical protein